MQYTHISRHILHIQVNAVRGHADKDHTDRLTLTGLFVNAVEWHRQLNITVLGIVFLNLLPVIALDHLFGNDRFACVKIIGVLHNMKAVVDDHHPAVIDIRQLL